MRSYAGFLNTSLDLTDKLTLGAGARYTIEDQDDSSRSVETRGSMTAPDVQAASSGQSRRFAELTPSADLSYRLSDSVTLTGRYARGFTSGGQAPDENRPEILNSYEFGLRSRWLEDRLLFNITGYRSIYDNIQVGASRTVLGADGASLLESVSTAKGIIQGLDVDFQTSLETRLGALDFGGGMGLINAQYKEFRADLDSAALGAQACVNLGTSCRGIFVEQTDDVLRLAPGTQLPRGADLRREFDRIRSELGTGSSSFEERRNRILGALGQSLQPGDTSRRNVDLSDLDFENTPSFSYNLFMRYQVDMSERGSLTAVSTWYQQNETSLNTFNTIKEDGFSVLDLSLSWVHPNGKFVVGAYVNNALDKRYLEGASESQDFDGAEGVFFSRPRTYGIQIGYQFGGI